MFVFNSHGPFIFFLSFLITKYFLKNIKFFFLFYIVELTCQLPSWSSTSGSQMMRETEVSPPRSIRTGYSSSPAHPHAATTLNSIQVSKVLWMNKQVYWWTIYNFLHNLLAFTLTKNPKHKLYC